MVPKTFQKLGGNSLLCPQLHIVVFLALSLGFPCTLLLFMEEIYCFKALTNGISNVLVLWFRDTHFAASKIFHIHLPSLASVISPL